jgi:hypothetical protein
MKIHLRSNDDNATIVAIGTIAPALLASLSPLASLLPLPSL